MINETIAYGKWGFVISLIAITLFFITKYLPMRTKFEKRSGGALLAFVAALFTEMYGFPLTIYLLSSYFGIDLPLSHVGSHLLGTFLTSIGLGNGWIIVMIVSNVLLLIGLHYIVEGWKLVYKAEGKPVTTGVYQKMRHPQYTGIYIIMIGFMIQWPTLITLIMFPFLVRMYYRLAKKEEKDVMKKYPEYKQYMERTPMFVPEEWLIFKTKNKKKRLND